LARKQSEPDDQAPAGDKPGGGLDVATVAPWILFWGWVALDGALAYRKNQAAVEQSAGTESPPLDYEDMQAEAPVRQWLRSSPAAIVAMIGAPIVAVAGPVLLGKLLRRRKS
jgi:hypothetical protein